MGETKVAELLTTQDMVDGRLDVQTLKEAVNEDKIITPRIGQEYASVPMASRLLVENGLLGATPFSTYTALTASALVDGDYAIVTNDVDLKKNGVYEKVGENWVYSKYNVQQTVNDIASVIQYSSDGLYLTDGLGFMLGELSKTIFKINGLITVEQSATSSITDDLGFVIGSQQQTSAKDLITVSEPLFAKTLCIFDNAHLSIDVPSLIRERELQYRTRQLHASISSGYSANNIDYVVSDNTQLLIDTSKLTDSIYLTLRDSAQANFLQMPISIKKANEVPTSPKILMIGDSISNRGLGDMLNQILSTKGHTPNFIGTMAGASASATSASDNTGQMGECREGWETGDYTYAINDRANIVTNESDYLALSKNDQWRYNPFLRQATASDNNNVVRNGYVFDPAFYQSRFNLETPDVVFIQLGTNDIRDRDQPELIDGFIDNMTIMVNQIKSTWSAAKIILSIPNTANDSARNELWSLEYHPLIRALINLQNTLPVTVCPTWALMTSECGFTITPSSGASNPAKIDNVTGALFGEYSDPVHPLHVTRYQMAHAIAPYIVCAINNLI